MINNGYFFDLNILKAIRYIRPESRMLKKMMIVQSVGGMAKIVMMTTIDKKSIATNIIINYNV